MIILRKNKTIEEKGALKLKRGFLGFERGLGCADEGEGADRAR